MSFKVYRIRRAEQYFQNFENKKSWAKFFKFIENKKSRAMFSNFREKLAAPAALVKEDAARLWSLSEQMTGVIAK